MIRANQKVVDTKSIDIQKVNNEGQPKVEMNPKVQNVTSIILDLMIYSILALISVYFS